MTKRMIPLMFVLAFLFSSCGAEITAVPDRSSAIQVSAHEKAPAPAIDTSGHSYSGDDAYDPAVEGGSPAEPAGEEAQEFLPDTGSRNPFRMAGNYSGDDPYDPAAGGLGR